MKVLIKLGLFIILGAMIYALMPDNTHRNELIAAAATPEDLAKALLDGREPHATKIGHNLSVVFDIGPQLTKGTAVSSFNSAVANVVPN